MFLQVRTTCASPSTTATYVRHTGGRPGGHRRSRRLECRMAMYRCMGESTDHVRATSCGRPGPGRLANGEMYVRRARGAGLGSAWPWPHHGIGGDDTRQPGVALRPLSRASPPGGYGPGTAGLAVLRPASDAARRCCPVRRQPQVQGFPPSTRCSLLDHTATRYTYLYTYPFVRL
jgi:hypothetical protein